MLSTGPGSLSKKVIHKFLQDVESRYEKEESQEKSH